MQLSLRIMIGYKCEGTKTNTLKLYFTVDEIKIINSIYIHNINRTRLKGTSLQKIKIIAK